VRIQLDPQRAELEAPYLHWCRSRIQRLVSEGQDRPAIALSVESNLICPLTAFIAWDEAEKVPVATHELVQPNMELAGANLACRSAFDALPASLAPRDTRFLSRPPSDAGLFRRMFGSRKAGDSAGVREAGVPDELELKRELSDICHKTGVADWEPLVKSLFDWIAEASGPERSRRLEALDRLVEELELQAELFERAQASREQKAVDEARERIQRLLKEFVGRLPVKS
jgi:hypothetical protein